MAQIARKLLSEAKPRTVNCDLGQSFLAPTDKMQFFFLSGEKSVFFDRVTGRKKCFRPARKKIIFLFSLGVLLLNESKRKNKKIIISQIFTNFYPVIFCIYCKLNGILNTKLCYHAQKWSNKLIIWTAFNNFL